MGLNLFTNKSYADYLFTYWDQIVFANGCHYQKKGLLDGFWYDNDKYLLDLIQFGKVNIIAWFNILGCGTTRETGGTENAGAEVWYTAGAGQTHETAQHTPESDGGKGRRAWKAWLSQDGECSGTISASPRCPGRERKGSARQGLNQTGKKNL